MKWYAYQDKLILPFKTDQQAILYACRNEYRINHFKPIRLPPMTPEMCQNYFKQVLNHCRNGHSLQDAFLNQNNFQLRDTASPYATAITSQLSHGYHITQAITELLPHSVKSLGKSIPLDNTEESKVAGVKVIYEALEEQTTLSSQLVKCLIYPFLVIQSALTLLILSSALQQTQLLASLGAWAVVTCLQIGAFIWIKNGHAYQLLCRYIPSFRKRRTLLLVHALISSGQPLQTAINTLINTSQGEDRNTLISIHFKLISGNTVDSSLPLDWFPKHQRMGIRHLAKTGDLNTPLKEAIEFWKQINQKYLNLLSKAFPIIGIVVASLFVTKTLITLYSPLMESSHIGL